MRIKEQMFLSHASQQSWLASHHGLDEVLGTVRELATSRGEIAGCAYAEGFRQHLGHAFPQGNVLREILRDFVHVTPPGERE
jgi:hypothetical protein